MDERRRGALELTGWGLFLIGCVLFLVQSAKAGDGLGIAGSACFTLGCVAFVAAHPAVRRRAHGSRRRDPERQQLTRRARASRTATALSVTTSPPASSAATISTYATKRRTPPLTMPVHDR